MKTKIKRHSRAVLSIVLTLCMLVSCMTVGIIATDAAKDNSEALGWNAKGGRVYFDTREHWQDANYIYFAVWYTDSGKQYRYLERLYNIPNTTLYTASLDNRINTSTVSSMRFIGTTTSWIPSSVNNGWRSYEADQSGYQGKYYTASTGVDMNSGDCYYGYVTSDSTDTAANLAYDSNGNVQNNSSWDVNQTVKVQYLNNGTWTDNSSSTKAGSAYVECVYYNGDQSTSSYGHSTSSYTTNTYENAAKHSYATAVVDSKVSSYEFVGWFNSSGTLLSHDEEYTYLVESTSTIYARFFKASEAYTTENPAKDRKLASGTLLFKKKSRTPNRVSVYDIDYGGGIKELGNYNDEYYYYTDAANLTDGCTPKAWVVGNGKTDWSDNDMCCGNISEPTGFDDSSLIWYYECTDSKNDGNWTAFEHLSVDISGVSSGNVDNPGEKVTLSTNVGGTLKNGATVKFYYTKDRGETYYLIGSKTLTSSSTTSSIDFYPPTTGVYTFYATISDSAGVEVDVPSENAYTLTVGREGYFVSGDTGFVGSNWGIAPTKGTMTNTSGTVWTKTFPNVASGTHEFRITSLTNWIGDASEYTLTGNIDLSVSGNNVQFALTGKSRVTVTFDATKDANNKYPVTVTVSDVVAETVMVYANTGGTVTTTYDGATFTTESGKNTKVLVTEGERITLSAAAASGYTFDHWEKNLETTYSTESSLTAETITSRTVYVACFKSSGGSSSVDKDTPVNNYKMVYHIGSINTPTSLDQTATVYRVGDRLVAYLDYSDINGENVYFAFSNSSTYSGIVNKDSSLTVSVDSGSTSYLNAEKVNVYDGGTQYYYGLANQWNSVPSGSVVMFDLAPATGSGQTSGYGSVTGYTVSLVAGSDTPGDDEVIYNASVTYYAKDSNFRSQSTAKNTYINVDTTVDEVEGIVTVTDDPSNNWQTGTAVKGSNITVRTTISGTCANGSSTVNAKDKFYVVGFSFNGITPQILAENDTGVYECTYTIPDNMAENYLEITPIYFLRDAYDDNTALFYINGYDDAIKNAGWGNTLFIYPFYKRYLSGDKDNNTGETTFYGQAQNFSGYPGQPVVNYGGQLYTQIPLTNDGSATGTDSVGNPIKGVTINNGYFDNAHKGYCKFVSAHHQTYDYDDFSKIYNEKKTKDGSTYLKSIFFSFKYYAQDTTNQHRSYSTTNSATKASRYNDMLASGRIGSTVSESTMNNFPSTTNKWEDLTDSLGNKVDIFGNKVTNASATPLKIISMGYEFNNSGEYATEWAIYKKDGSNYKLVYDTSSSAMGSESALNSSIVPSALVMNSASSFANYTAMDGDQPINGYEDLYTALSTACAGLPAEICYEYDAPIKYNTPPAYRCDGRWTYTTVNDFVKSNVVIEYKGNGATSYAVDPFVSGSNVGTNTKAKAYFTNSDYYGLTESTSELIDSKDYYTFKAEDGGSYEFVGWYTKDTSGKYMKIDNVSADNVAESSKTANMTFVARFDYVASGTLTISNGLASGQDGRATTYLGVTLINGTKETVLANVNSNTSSVKVDSSYINSSSNYSIKIDIRTVPIGENHFASYACNTINGSDVKASADDTDIYDDSSSANATDSYTIEVKRDIYNNTTTQVVKAIEYVSTLTPVSYTYLIKYNYKSRGYGNQAYTKEGTLTAGQISDTTVVTGTQNTADKKLTKDFIVNKIAPYESNFNESITWNIDSIIDTQTCTYDSETNTYHIVLDIPLSSVSTESTASRNAYFTVPYKLSSTKNGVADIKTDETDPANIFKYVEKADDYNTFTIASPYGTLLKDADNNIVKAPEKMLISGDASEKVYKYFQYWKFSTTKGKEVGKCYYPEFNYLLYENYNIEAVYDNDPANYGQDYNKDQSTTVSYIGSTRNQWNKNDRGTNTNYAGDVIYNDLILSFKPGGNDPINKISGAQTGIIIQRLDEVTLNASGKNSMTLDEYASKFTAEQLATAKTAATSAVTESGTYQGILCAKQAITTAKINDKNRIHYAYSMYNFRESTQGTVHNNSNKMYFYRVYSYMIVNGKTVVSDSPTYFCMYDIATE